MQENEPGSFALRFAFTLAFIAIVVFDVLFAFRFYEFIDRGRGLYGSTVFTIIVATIALLSASGFLLTAFDEKTTSPRAAIRQAAMSAAPVRRPTIFFPIFMTMVFALFVWDWATDSHPPQPTQVATAVLLCGYPIVQYFIERRRWLRERAGILPGKPDPLIAYLSPSVWILILLLQDLNGRGYLPGWFHGLTLVLCVGLPIAFARTLVISQKPSRT